MKPWKNVLRAHKDGPMCLQKNPYFREYEVHGEEDCLYLNVYAPEVVNKTVPVMVFFHGGGIFFHYFAMTGNEIDNQ